LAQKKNENNKQKKTKSIIQKKQKEPTLIVDKSRQIIDDSIKTFKTELNTINKLKKELAKLSRNIKIKDVLTKLAGSDYVNNLDESDMPDDAGMIVTLNRYVNTKELENSKRHINNVMTLLKPETFQLLTS